MCEASCQPTTIRLYASRTNAKKTSPSQQRRYERSATQSSFGPRRRSRAGRDPAGGQPADRAEWSATASRAASHRRSRCLHQPLHPATWGLLAGAAKRLPHPPVAVGVVVVVVQLADPCEQPFVLDRRTDRRPPALVVRGHRHAQGLADRLDPEAAAVLVDVAAHFGRSGSSSFTKNTLADFRISLARRNSKFSLRSRRISSRSSLVGRSGLSPVGFRLAHTLPQRLLVDPQISGDVRDRPAALKRQPDAALEQLLGILPRSRHDAEDLLSPGQHPGRRSPRNPVRLRPPAECPLRRSPSA